MFHHRKTLFTASVNQRDPARRGGFTLVELLVVLMILTTLASLALGGILRLRHAGTVAKTRATLRKLNEVVIPYYEEYEYERITLPGGLNKLSSGQMAGLRRLLLRYKMALELPERAGDLEGAFVYPRPPSPTMANTVAPLALADSTFTIDFDKDSTPDPIRVAIPPAARRYRALINLAHGRTDQLTKPAHTATREQQVSSAELLHMIVTRGPASDPEIVSHFRNDEVADTDGDGLLEFVDGWGRPIEFIRWPVGYRSVFQPLNGAITSIDITVSPNGHRLVPLIYSTGADKSGDMVTRNATGFSYHDVGYDPFAFNKTSGTGAMAIEPSSTPLGATYLQAFCRNIPGTGRVDPVTFVAGRVQRGIDPSVVPPDPNWTAVGKPFYAIGSEFDLDNDGRVNSLDNITNHDLTR